MSSAAASSSSRSHLQSKSPAEFFAEHQNIAGFDNPGKSLYTTVREFVENSLDAAESIRVLPVIEVRIEKLSAVNFQQLRGVEAHQRADHGLYSQGGAAGGAGGNKKNKTSKNNKKNQSKEERDKGEGEEDKEEEGDDKSSSSFFRVVCRDNGGGMPHADIPRMLGIVLSSTKYGVKQTRGKFGLGAKMALVWAMKSTGLPIQVHSAVSAKQPISDCKLYIDINRNQPDIVSHTQRANTDGWQGTEISVIIGGKWTNYQSKILNYMRQLAVITPYAQIQMEYIDGDKDSKSWTVLFQRRTDVMPPPPIEVKHHPTSVDNLLVEQLIHHSKTGTKLHTFLRTSFSNISAALAERLIDELGGEFDRNIEVKQMSKKQIHLITQLLRQAKFDKPDAKCLSAAGEYNLRLGIMKELNPDADVHEGHPFHVEAAVSLGGTKAKPGISVYRYANRIPLLFEGGNDVVSIVANKKIKWSSYKLNCKVDKLSVFVSIVSTKIPFKGTSKEYIGDDKGVLQECIKRCITACCIQLKRRLVSAAALREKADRRKQMAKFIPDVSRSFMAVLHHMADQSQEGRGASLISHDDNEMEEESLVKRRRLADDAEGRLRYAAMSERVRINEEDKQSCWSMIRAVRDEEVSEELLEEKLQEHVDAKDAELTLELNAEESGMTHAEGGAAISAAAFYLGGIDTTQMDGNAKAIFGPQFKITCMQ